MSNSINLTIDGIPVTVPKGTRILEAARKVNVRIPTLCDHPDLCKRAVCRICVVECDGRGKLAAACANDVWEGASVVTNNDRIFTIRKTIIELLLANHPQECLTCVRSKNCELQTLAAEFGIREMPFRHSPADRRPPSAESETLVRDMGKCIKCGRCVDVCQERQNVRAINSARRGPHYGISAPYDQALADGPCVFCGRCIDVCPVGAIYEYDHSAHVWTALRDHECHTAAQIVPQAGKALGVSAGQMVTALKRLGFDRVYDAGIFARAGAAAVQRELGDRLKNKGQSGKPNLPMITVSSPGLVNFIEGSYPDLVHHLTAAGSPRQLFVERVNATVKDVSTTVCVSIVASAAEKYKPPKQAAFASAPDFALTIRELSLMIKLAGIDGNGLPETPFDSPDGEPEIQSTIPAAGITTLTVHNLAEAHPVMQSIRDGKCTADLVEIMNWSVTET